MEITFFGATKQVTGSCFRVKGKKVTVMVDCGLFQGGKESEKLNEEPMPFACGEINHVLITHAHLDHTGRLPRLCLEGFKGSIFATKPTLDLVKYLWDDMLEIMEIDYQNTGKLPLYSPEQVKRTLSFFKGVDYQKKIMLSDTDYAIFHDAGHILGSAFIELVIDGKRAVFSGDIGNVKPPIIQETKPLPSDVDVLITESTYGNRIHETAPKRKKILFSMVDETLKRKGTLLIPAFAIERTQEILYTLNNLIEENIIPACSIFLDSPLAIKTTSVFEKYPDFYNKRDQLLRASGDDLFDFPGLILSRTRRQSKQINKTPGPKIIIAGSGMMTGGRILFHLERYLPDPKTTLFIVGYQAEGTMGRKILGGQKTVKIFHRSIPVRADIHAIGAYSAHADQKKLISWMKHCKNLKQVCLVHGDMEAMDNFAEAIKTKLNLPVCIPKLTETIKL